MKTASPYALFTIVSMALMLGACAPVDDSVGNDEKIQIGLKPNTGGTSYEPPSGRNGLRPSEFWSEVAQTAYRDMQYRPLSTGQQIGGVDILNAPVGSPLHNLIITYPKAAVDLLECALTENQTVHDNATGLDIKGWWGIAPDWMNAPIAGSTDKEEWLTGCMLARLNYFGIEVPILLEGDTPPIQTDPLWNVLMPFDESTLYGNMFNSRDPIADDTPAFAAYLCRENQLASVCKNDDGKAYVDKRICDDVPSLCGLIDLGLCDPTAPGSLQSCRQGRTPEHWDCMTVGGSGRYEFRTVGVQLERQLNQNDCAF